ncbi:hypothetical protein PT015_20045 [Candidatus Mycobacterium wuenschmannii]|uniref:Intersectin-EH binding protein Ibp1 n=1 Tax=Candidatus Mycobacterium wuenschmannii TaxID=3027808 RepID=A0ABY8VWH1_9MYCO|nr:hypothetical protein [Candidatus Mycobacterium wuenschmannii]WIM87134.1 hypothetical protein PT015_20045 [Candidatus Mycobacterium wuenschmannii]
MFTQRTVIAILAGVGASALVAVAPIAGADDPLCEQKPPDQRQQCEQNPGAGIPDQIADAAQRGPQLVKPFIDPKTGKVNPGPVGVRALINGVDTCMPAGTPAPLGADVQPVPGDPTGHCILGS